MTVGGYPYLLGELGAYCQDILGLTYLLGELGAYCQDSQWHTFLLGALGAYWQDSQGHTYLLGELGTYSIARTAGVIHICLERSEGILPRQLGGTHIC